MLAAAVLVFVVLWHLTIGRRAALKWLALVPVPLAAASVFALLAEPSIDDARAQVKAGRLDAAEIELRALGSEADPDLQPVWADFYLARLNQEPPKLTMLRERLVKDRVLLDKQIAAEERKLAAEERKLAAQRAAEEARQRRLEERETKRRAAEERRNESRWSGGGCCKYCSTASLASSTGILAA